MRAAWASGTESSIALIGAGLLAAGGLRERREDLDRARVARKYGDFPFPLCLIANTSHVLA